MTVNNVLIVGGGFTGLTSAIALAERGVEVVLAERAPAWARIGHGITIQGNALRVFKKLGVYDGIIGRSQPEEGGIDLVLANGQQLAHIATPRTGGPDLPPTIGALRADLHEVLVDKATALGVTVLLGKELVGFTDRGDSITAAFADGSTLEAELLIVADGIKSQTRAKLGIREDRASSGLGIWRAVTERRPDMLGAIAYPLGPGGAFKVGYTPVSATQCYIFVLCPPSRPDNGLEDYQEVQRLMADFHGQFDDLRDGLNADTFLNFQEIEWIFVEGPWHRGRAIALGEAVHAVPPLIAQGAAQCVEDSLVFAEIITKDGDLEDLFAEFHARRIPRIKGVVDASLQLADWEQHPGSSKGRDGEVMDAALSALVPVP